MAIDGQGLDGIERRGLMFVLSSPSGAGKTTMSRLLMERMPDMRMSVSVTTRQKRPGEVEGRDYHFVDKARFVAMEKNGELLEWATVFDNLYGTPRKPVEEALATGHDVLFDIDWQGARQLRAAMPGDLASVFILPPDAPALERRLRTRAQDSEEVVRLRLSAAATEIAHWGEYDYVIVNADVDASLAGLRAILAAERLKRARQRGLPPFVGSLLAQL